MSSEIIQSVAYDNYDDFNMSNSYFHKISFHYFENLVFFMDMFTLKKRFYQ
jgi:hypothetical protein